MQHPDLNSLIQQSIHSDRISEADTRRRMPSPRPVARVRVITGQTLMAIGARIAATPRQVNARQVIGEVSIAGDVNRP